MEGLIFAIVIFIISALFGKDKKKDKPTKQMPPFSPQKVPPSQPVKANPAKARPVVKSLEDFANEVFGQLNEKAEQQPVRQERQQQPVRQERQQKPVAVEPRVVTGEALQQVKEARQTLRPKLIESSRPLVQQATTKIDVVPRTREQLIQAMVSSEILGPPKAKR